MLQLELAFERDGFDLAIDLRVPAHEIVCLFGPSGAGKSTVLAIAAGLESGARTRLRGLICADGERLLDTEARPPVSVPAWRRRFGYVTQTPHLFPHLTVRDNIVYGAPKRRGKPEPGADWRILAERFGIAPQLRAKPAGLSGGMAQRAALVRALATKPRALLLDEPFSALDAGARRELQDALLAIRAESGLTALFVTHDLSEAERMADRMAVIDQGRILQQGRVEDIVLRPATERVARIVGYTQICDVEGLGRVGIHPDRALIGECPHAGAAVSGVVLDSRLDRARWRAHVRLDSGAAIDATAYGARPEEGRRVRVTLLSPPRFP